MTFVYGKCAFPLARSISPLGSILRPKGMVLHHCMCTSSEEIIKIGSIARAGVVCAGLRMQACTNQLLNECKYKPCSTVHTYMYTVRYTKSRMLHAVVVAVVVVVVVVVVKCHPL